MEGAIGRGPPRDDSPPNFERIGPAVIAILRPARFWTRQQLSRGKFSFSGFPRTNRKVIPLSVRTYPERKIHFQRFSPRRTKESQCYCRRIPAVWCLPVCPAGIDSTLRESLLLSPHFRGVVLAGLPCRHRLYLKRVSVTPAAYPRRGACPSALPA